jgi:hypothetical protein
MLDPEKSLFGNLLIFIAFFDLITITKAAYLRAFVLLTQKESWSTIAKRAAAKIKIRELRPRQVWLRNWRSMISSAIRVSASIRCSA